ncbi:hypothetical protein JZ751_008877 [Albula glossodonta]|uniref:Uncharacterized protein n=1 Tax=Albula glossodonta TaxID=121402 RepID=A0A8T2NXG2_9TELE|nr:hypothetical protein JZ751_008877 [Albula glossodonta]
MTNIETELFVVGFNLSSKGWSGVSDHRHRDCGCAYVTVLMYAPTNPFPMESHDHNSPAPPAGTYPCLVVAKAASGLEESNQFSWPFGPNSSRNLLSANPRKLFPRSRRVAHIISSEQ